MSPQSALNSGGGRSAAKALQLRRWGKPQGWLQVARLSELAEQTPTEVYPGGHPVVLVRQGEEVFALDGRCPHRGGPLAEGKVEGGAIRCPWHGFRYDLRTGEPLFLDAWGPAPAYAVRVVGGKVELLVQPAGDNTNQ